jgi:ABC-2 type transport system ATP-binding protein
MLPGRRLLMRWIIRTENLTKFFGKQRGVEGLSLDVEAGEVFGFLGLNGAGKTTTLRLLLDFIRPTEGWATVMGLDCRRQSHEIRKNVGYSSSRFNPYPHMTGEEMLRYMGNKRGCLDWPYTQYLSDIFGLNLRRHTLFYSKPEKQKLNLVQAFMQQNQLLLLDEPLTGLDDGICQEFYQLVSQARAAGCTVFFSTASLADVERVCDRTAVMHRGQLVSLERGVHLRGRILRRVVIRFSGGVSLETFSRLPNLQDLKLEENVLSCLVTGDLDPLIKAASRYRVCDLISQRASLEESLKVYYGIDAGGEN